MSTFAREGGGLLSTTVGASSTHSVLAGGMRHWLLGWPALHKGSARTAVAYFGSVHVAQKEEVVFVLSFWPGSHTEWRWGCWAVVLNLILIFSGWVFAVGCYC